HPAEVDGAREAPGCVLMAAKRNQHLRRADPDITAARLSLEQAPKAGERLRPASLAEELLSSRPERVRQKKRNGVKLGRRARRAPLCRRADRFFASATNTTRRRSEIAAAA